MLFVTRRKPRAQKSSGNSRTSQILFLRAEEVKAARFARRMPLSAGQLGIIAEEFTVGVVDGSGIPN